MGVLFAFLVGWSVGAKAGPSGYDEVVEAAKAVRQSSEFNALVAVTRTHVAESLTALGKIVSGETAMPDAGDLLAQVQRLTARRPG